jgi:hypothetical protein
MSKVDLPLLLRASASIVLLAYLLPEWAAFARSDVFVFVNGWDEETYLSWQGVLGASNDPGYFVLHLYRLMHEAGLSGAMQNLLSDTLFPLLTVLLVTLSFRRLGVERSRAFAYAVLVLFSSTLFNYANPVTKLLLGDYDGTAFLMAGWELYPSILRTPNPQLPYLLVALAVYAWLRWRRFWHLLLPLPVLYYFVAVPYAFTIGLGSALTAVRRTLTLPEWQTMAISAASSYILMALGAVGLFALLGYYDPDHWMANNTWVYAKTRMPQLPLAVLLILSAVLVMWRLGVLGSDSNKGRMLLVLMLTAIASANLHVVTGFMLAQKNYYDYGLSILFGLMLVAALEWINDRQLADWILAILLVIVFIPTLASHLYFYHRAVGISVKATPIIGEVRQDPLHAVIPDLEVSSRMAYSTARLLAPPFSYQYYFQFIEKQCRHYPELLLTSLEWTRQQYPTREDVMGRLESTAENIRRGQIESRTVPYKNLSYCRPEVFQPHGFNLLGIER